MEASLAVCILAALLAMGACLRCEVCRGQGIRCGGDLQTCAAGQDSCGIALTEMTWEGEKTQSIVTGCATASQCQDGPFPVSFGMGKTRRTSFTCCQGDACTPSPITVPPAATEPNGRSCPACYAPSSQQCREETINCPGVETRCVEIAGPLKSGGTASKTVMKGCTQIEAGSATFAGFSGDLTTAKCTAATSAAGSALGPAGVLFPALAGLLLLTLLS